MTWRVLNELISVHTLAYRLSRGLVGHRFPIGPPFLLLDHRGAKSGKARTSPLLYVEDGDNLVIVASKGGHPRHPAWFHNLRAHPETEVEVPREGRRRVRARVASDEERERLWPRAVALYKPYAAYEAHTERKIPLVVLERA